jgi:hypothetical protein
MTVRAKFRYTGYAATHMSRQIAPGDQLLGAKSADPRNYEVVEARTMTFNPVYGTDPDSENRLFWQATPSGELKLQMVNPEAWSQFEMGKYYYLDLTPAPD